MNFDIFIFVVLSSGVLGSEKLSFSVMNFRASKQAKTAQEKTEARVKIYFFSLAFSLTTLIPRAIIK